MPITLLGRALPRYAHPPLPRSPHLWPETTWGPWRGPEAGGAVPLYVAEALDRACALEVEAALPGALPRAATPAPDVARHPSAEARVYAVLLAALVLVWGSAAAHLRRVRRVRRAAAI